MTDELAQALLAELRALREEMARQRQPLQAQPAFHPPWSPHYQPPPYRSQVVGIGERFPDGTIYLPQN